MADFQGYPIIDEAFNSSDPDHGRGYMGRDLSEFPLGGLKCARMISKPAIDPACFKELIAEKDAKKLWIFDNCDVAGRHCKDQNGTNYCWGNAPCGIMEVQILMQGGPVLDLSAAFACSQIMGGANVGGSGIQWVKWVNENGCCTTEFWPLNQVRGRASQEAFDNAKRHRIDIWNEFDPQDYDSIYASVLAGEPVTIGIPSMSHEMYIGRLTVDSRGQIIPIVENSWAYTWGKLGRAVLSGAAMRWDEAGSVGAVSASLT